MSLFDQLKSSLKLNPKLQPCLHRLKHVFKVLTCRDFSDKSGKSEQFLFIVGCGRSGNTLLRRLLMERFDIYIPPETYVLPKQINHYSLSTLLRWPDKVDSTLSILENHPEFETFGVESFAPFKSIAKGWQPDKQTFVDLLEGLYHWIGAQHNLSGQWVGDKTPLNTLSLGILHWAFPKAKFIFLERDPVDVVQSYLNAEIYKTAGGAAQRWRNSFKSWQSFKKLKSDTDILELRYEDLVSGPEEALERIATKFSIPERSIEQKISPSHLGDVDARKHHRNAQNTPSTTSIGKGRKSISVENLGAMRRVLGGLPQKRGYERL